MTDKPTKPTPPDPCASPAEHRKHAEDNASWSDWIAEHPEDDDDYNVLERSGESGAQ